MFCEIRHKRPGSEFGAIKQKGKKKKGIFILPFHLVFPFGHLNCYAFLCEFFFLSSGALHYEASCNRHLTLNNRLSFYANEVFVHHCCDAVQWHKIFKKCNINFISFLGNFLSCFGRRRKFSISGCHRYLA